jgi:acetylornithine deacetylase/succinyl-diaminopimelate desuccinylase-like protein
LVGGIVLARADLQNESPGAVDNASGVVAVLATLDRLPAGGDIGVCFTDAEEWGLQGARALVRERPELFRDAAVINFDGLDDRGGILLFAHRPGPLVVRLAGVAGVRAHRWLPALVDGVAFAGVARECVTVMRGDWRTARRVHTPRDDAARLGLDGVRQAAVTVADALAAA